MTLPRMITDLLRPEAYPDRPERVDLIQTHISYILLTPTFAYKVKKPVNFGFLDFTTLEKRRFFCNEEVRLNSRLSPEMYLGVVEVVERDGAFLMEGRGRVVDYAVKMERLPQERMMDHLLKEGRVSEEAVRRVVRRMASFYKAEGGNGYIASFGRPEAIRRNTEENFRQTEPYIGRTIEREEFERIRGYTKGFLQGRRGLFLGRMDGGWIKDCHGDLHSSSICLRDGIVIFDCIEFNERFRYSDTVADMAFLAMDLDFHFRRDLAMVLVEEYEEAMDDREVEDLFTFYKVYRAYVRGKVEGFELDEVEVPEGDKGRIHRRVRRYFRLASSYVEGRPYPLLVAVCGLIGTGKTSIAEELKDRLHAETIQSDRVRKELAGLPPEEHLYVPFGSGIYSEEFTRRTYMEVLARARRLLAGGKGVILDATFSRGWMREEVLRLGRECGAEVVFLECTAPEALIRERLMERMGRVGVSDGRWEIYLQAKRTFEPFRGIPEGAVFRADTSMPIMDSIRAFMEWLGL